MLRNVFHRAQTQQRLDESSKYSLLANAYYRGGYAANGQKGKSGERASTFYWNLLATLHEEV